MSEAAIEVRHDREQNGLQAGFFQTAEQLFAALRPDEHLTAALYAEDSQFVRFNRGRVRQAGSTRDAQLALALVAQGRSIDGVLPFSGSPGPDFAAALQQLAELRAQLGELPEDPYLILPEDCGTSEFVECGQLLAEEEAAARILEPAAALDFVGLYAAGPVVRAVASSAGTRHWFSAESFTLDFSLGGSSEQVVKGGYAGSQWNDDEYRRRLCGYQERAALLAQPAVSLRPGKFRAYIAPEALIEIIHMFSWNGLSEAAFRQEQSPLMKLLRAEVELSPQFHLEENFAAALVPRFNRLGELAPATLALVEAGRVKQRLVSSRSGKEYRVPANGAHDAEVLRAPLVRPGMLRECDILGSLDTGLYLGQLFYLNWSDRLAARITGMTRSGCFWVEQGRIKGPLERMRFDDSLYSLLGANLAGITEQQEFIPNTDTYEHRNPGGALMPGLLIEDFNLVL